MKLFQLQGLLDAAFMGRNDVEQEVAILLTRRHVLLELAVVSQKHLEEAGFLTPHLRKEGAMVIPDDIRTFFSKLVMSLITRQFQKITKPAKVREIG